MLFIQPPFSMPFPCFPCTEAACQPGLQSHKTGHFLSPERFSEDAPEAVRLLLNDGGGIYREEISFFRREGKNG
ncbi:hypothetical protein HMPREF3038_02651 [Akkermansia sp. KLE1797]|nr:hypothetical protein HMPREF3038_02651 [Akkermansia sp. KLE1797]